MTRYVYYMDKEALLIFNSAENIIHLLTSVILGDLHSLQTIVKASLCLRHMKNYISVGTGGATGAMAPSLFSENYS